MENFVDDLDEIYTQYKNRKHIKKCIYLPICIKYNGKSYKNYLIRKDNNTKFVYIKDDCRVFFSDADILNNIGTWSQCGQPSVNLRRNNGK